MRTVCVFLMFVAISFAASPQPSMATEAEKDTLKQNTRSRMIFGPPVNVNLMGAGGMPEGKLLTVINTSFAEKTRAKDGAKSPDVFSQVWLLKLRYGITDYLELWSTTPYISNRRTNPEPDPKNIYGVGDSFLGLLFSPLHERRGDPLTASVSAAFLIPIAAQGSHHPPGMGVSGFRGQAGVGKFLTRSLKIETEGVWNTRFDRGNQDVRLGDQFQWNGQVRYLFDHFDLGLESNLTWQRSSDRVFPGLGAVDLRNGYTDWFIGPSANFAIDKLGMWAGIGVFLPVIQRFDSPSKVENARFEFKIGKIW